MRLLRAFVGLLLFFELPIPLYWLMIHPLDAFWRKRVRAAFWIAGLAAWSAGGVLLWTFHTTLLRLTRPSWAAFAAGFILISVEIYLLRRVEHELGARRLVGHAELTGTGEMFTGGLYGHVRHPRYAGMFGAVAGAGLLAGTSRLWLVLIIWWLFALAVIRLEERELERRFGAAYTAYRKRVPAFVPLRFRGSKEN